MNFSCINLNFNGFSLSAKIVVSVSILFSSIFQNALPTIWQHRFAVHTKMAASVQWDFKLKTNLTAP